MKTQGQLYKIKLIICYVDIFKDLNLIQIFPSCNRMTITRDIPIYTDGTGTNIITTNTAQYLGVVIDKNLNYKSFKNSRINTKYRKISYV